MFTNYKTALRNIKSNKLNTLIKILGISLGLITLIFILVFVKYELSYDKHFPSSENIYRVVRNWQESETFSSSTPAMLTAELNHSFPEIESSSRLIQLYDANFVIDNHVFYENNAIAVDSSFFFTFNVSLINGNKHSALNAPGSVIISESKSQQFFGKQNAIGKQITLEGGYFSHTTNEYTVTGVFKDFADNSHLKPDILLSFSSFLASTRNERTSHSLASYVRLKEGTNPSVIEAKLPEFMRAFYGDNYYDFARNEYKLQAITDIHLDTWVYPYGYETQAGNRNTIILFPLLAALVLIIALINYLNLTISEGMKRTMNFGINKISGANKTYFLNLFFSESFLIILFTVGIVSITCPFLLDIFNSIMGRNIPPSAFTSIQILLSLFFVVFAFIVLITLIPTLIFSRKNAIDYLSGKFGSKNNKGFIHAISQTTQFAICIFLFIGSIMVYKQLVFMHSKTNDKMNIDNVLVVNNARFLEQSRKAFKQQLKSIPGIKAVSICDEIPGNGQYSNWGYPIDPAIESAHVNVFHCDEEYLDALSIKMKEGRFFSTEYSTDNDAIVLNESAVKRLGWQDNAIGKHYYLGKAFQVIGVAPDIHFEALQYQIEPMAFIPNRSETSASKVMIKVNGKNITKTINEIETLWAEFVPERSMQYGFINQEFEQWYKSERRTSVLAIVLSIIAMFLAGLGLFAAILYKVEIRIKEIGIRKVNGAKIYEIVQLLNKDFIIWVIIAYTIASPLSYFGISKWLQNFAYQTQFSWWVFALSGILALGIAILTVSWHSWKAARSNPVEALRYE